MVSGTDDHGTPITYGADKEGISPRQFADRYNRVILEDQLKRQPARPHRPDRPALARQRRGAGVSRDRALLLRPAGLRQPAAGMDRQAGALASQRARFLAQLHRRAEAARHHQGPGLGRADPAGRLARPGRQADLRLVRRRHGIPLSVDRVGRQPRHTGRLEGVVAGPRRARLLLHGQGQHHLPHRDVALDPARRRRPQPALRGGGQRVPDHGGQEVLVVAQRRHLRARLPVALRPGRVALLPHHRRPGNAGHGFHVGRVRAPKQRRAGRHLGQPRAPHAGQRAPQLRCGAAGGCSQRPRSAGAVSGRSGLRDRRRSARSRAFQGRHRRGHAPCRTRQPIPRRGAALAPREERP